MMVRLPTASALVALALLLGLPNPSRAAFVAGTQGLADLGSPTINTFSLATATVFYIDDMYTTRAETGAFASPRSVNLELGSAVLDINNISSFSFGSTDFGFFSGVTLLLAQTDLPSVRSYQLNGTFTPGTRYGSTSPVSATFTISFTQTSGGGNAISDSGTLSIPALTTVPEPASAAMLGLGLVAAAGVGRRRRAA